MTGNLARLLDLCAGRWPGKPVLIQDDDEVSWLSLDRRAGAVAAMLAGRGVGPGDRVVIDLKGKISLTVAVLGALKAGAAVTPLNPRLTANERRMIIDGLAPSVVVDELGDDEAEFPSREVAGNEAAFILFTSGSTGEPKGVTLSHRATAMALDHWKGPVMDLGNDDVVLSTLPPAHSFGIFGSILSALLAGASVVLLDRFTPEDALKLIARHRVTVFPGVATMFQRIVDDPGLAETDVSSLRFAVSGAGPCPWQLAQQWQAATGVRIIRGYGMTELFRPISFSPKDQCEVADSIGRAVAGVKLRIMGEDGAAMAAGEAGELWINSPARFDEYFNRPDETRAVLDGAWFKTGDLATISKDGFVSIVGRKKDVILRGGYTVDAAEIEALLMSHPDIAEAAVIPIPHRVLGEDIAAFVTLRPGREASQPADIIEYCKQRIASYKYPREVVIRHELPKGPTGKILKAALKQGSG